MNIISILGLIPYIQLSYYYRSHGMLLIALNGLIFHANPKNKFFYFLDFNTNMSLFILTSIKESSIIKYSIFCLFAFYLNIKYIKNYNNILCDIFHVVFVQWVGLYAITQFHLKHPCNLLLFYC